MLSLNIKWCMGRPYLAQHKIDYVQHVKESKELMLFGQHRSRQDIGIY